MILLSWARAFAALLLCDPPSPRIEAAVLRAEEPERDGREGQREKDEGEGQPRIAKPPPKDMTRPHTAFAAFA